MSLKNLEEKLDDDIYIIPVLLDDIEQEQIERPVALQHIQMINGYLPEGKEQILDSIKTQFEKMKIKLKHIQGETKVFWTVKPIVKSWDGFLGYKVNFDFIEFQSNRYKDMHYIADQPIETRTELYEGKLGRINFKGNIISIEYNFDHYGAGAMHGSQWTECYNFILDPLIKVNAVSWLLDNIELGFQSLQQIIRDKLVEYLVIESDDEWGYQNIIDGTQEQEGLSVFSFVDSHIEFKFRNYQVCCYAQGNPSISIPYDEIYHLLSKQAKEQLGLE